MSKTLVIAEKPSVGRDLGAVLPGPFTKHEGYLEGPEHIVTWAVGHLVQLADPDEYDDQYKKWRMADLPIVPDVQAGRPRRALEEADERGQAAARPRRRRPGGQRLRRRARGRADLRLPVREGRLQAARAAAVAELDDQRGDQGRVRHLRPGAEFPTLEEAARSRSEADWIVGMNATRAATIRLRSSFDGAVSLGRVQTPTLAILARREQEIRDFMPEPYWVVDAALRPVEARPRRYEGRFHAGAKPRMATAGGRTAIVAACEGQTGTITKLEKSERKERPQLLYDLTSLQRDAEPPLRLHGAAHAGCRPAALRGAQGAHVSAHELALHDQRHDPRDQADRRAGRRAAPSTPKAAEYVTGLDVLPLGRVVNNEKVTDHHAIIPTLAERHPVDKMDDDDRRDLRPGRAPLPGGLPSRGGVREHARRDDGRRAHVPHARQGAAGAGLARRLRRDCRRRRRTQREDDEGGEQQLPKLEQGEQSRSTGSAPRRRRPSRRGATPTARCSARWRPPASSSTTRSCARR